MGCQRNGLRISEEVQKDRKQRKKKKTISEKGKVKTVTKTLNNNRDKI